ncbi:hypothetical protein EJ02DRAFT_343333 [Clathrospora elynae]|uniref:Uncharacterized protein n=1 Tax=Clathrospora elynae TaxID=706981 RepID=A0A6A5SY37_9PLEO|nr:hypothetical protein EJ02DRAFT_343333 [Clathrospora elynae]
MAAETDRYKFTREELLGSTNIAAREWQLIDPERWYNDIEAPDDEVDATAATTYIARAIADYTDRPTADEELFSEFCQDFQGWNEVMFRRAHAIYTKELKRILRFKGVYTGRLNMVPAEALVGMLNREDFLRWPDETFQDAVFDKRSAAYMLQQRIIDGRHATVRPTDAGPARRARNQAPVTVKKSSI